MSSRARDHITYTNIVSGGLLTRTPGPLPRWEILRKPLSIDTYEHDDFRIVDDIAQSHIAAPVAV